MSLSEPIRGQTESPPGRFVSTHWSLVLSASDSHAPESADALEKLCQAYWYPLYAFVRYSGYGPEEAKDLTQEFFARLLEKKLLKHADRERGHFRTFLLSMLKNFLTNEWRRGQTLKRGGGKELLPLDTVDAEDRFTREPVNAASPEAVYERRWAMTLLARAQERLREEMTETGEGERFEVLEPTLVGDRTEEGYAALGARLGLGVAGVKSMVLRFRRRYRALVRWEIAQTLDEGQDIETELRELFKAVA